MGFEFLETSRKLRQERRQRRRSWERFWLAFSAVCLVAIGSLALLKAFQTTLEDPEPVAPRGPAPEFFQAPEPEASIPDLLRERPPVRPAPESVNEFLRQEQALNSSRVALLQQQEVDIETVDFTARCLPQWDFRSPAREIIWFYYYTSGAIPNGRRVTVFGAVDGLGQPLFQYPQMAGDPLALLDSQYVGLKWIALDEPRVALIAGTNGPWPRCGAVVDVFLVEPASADTDSQTRFWRFDDVSYAERPPLSSRLISFCDANGDGLRDLCAFWLAGTGDVASPEGIFYPYLSESRSFAVEPSPLASDVVPRLRTEYESMLQGAEPAEPSLLAAPATEQIFEEEPSPSAGTGAESDPRT